MQQKIAQYILEIADRDSTIKNLRTDNDVLSEENKTLKFDIDKLQQDIEHRDAIITDLTALNSKYKTKANLMVQKNTYLSTILDAFKSEYMRSWPKVHSDFINPVTKTPTMNMFFGIHPWDVDRTIPVTDRVVKWTTKGAQGVSGAEVFNTGIHSFAQFDVHKYGGTDYIPFTALMDKQYDPDPPSPRWRRSGLMQTIEITRWNHQTWEYADESLWPHYERTMNTYNARIAQYLFMLDNMMNIVSSLDLNNI